MENDQTLLEHLARYPEAGLAALMQRYTGLVWSVAAGYLGNPEDIKECVNDTFAEFYRERERFDPEKGSLKLFLATIARRRAIDRLRASGRAEIVPLSEELPARDGVLPEDRAALAAALDSLPEEDAAILRMKYYGGMSFREIAASLHLPYETVKKRHQRSLKKMKKMLLLGLLLALAALLTACAYLVLRYFGLVPGYGVNTDPAGAIYVLEEGPESQGAQLQLEDAWWQSGTFTALVWTYGGGDASRLPEVSLKGLEVSGPGAISHALEADTGIHRYRLAFPSQLPPEAGDTVSLTLTVDGTVFPITLTAAEETKLEEAGFYQLTEEGGLLAVPRLERGELIVAIYPLDSGDFSTDPLLTQGAMAGYGGPTQPITVTAPDGTVLEGTLEEYSYSLFDESGYLEWNFGPAQAGDYILNVPSIFQYAAQGEDMTLSLDLTAPEPVSLALPGGTLDLSAPAPIDDPTDYGLGALQASAGDYRWWAVEGNWTGEDPERAPAFLIAQATAGRSVTVSPWLETQRDRETGLEYNVWKGFLVGAEEGTGTVDLTIPAESIAYCWDHPFAISMAVEPEPEREEYTQTSGSYGLTAVPRREKGQVILDLYPQSTQEQMAVSPGIARSPLADAVDQPVTLIGEDGSSWEGTLELSRDGTYSHCSFGDLPAGDYTLHVPYLYLTDSRSYHGAVPLPRVQGEVLPAGPVQVGASRLLLGDVTGLGQMPEFPYENLDFADVISYPDGSVAACYELPLQAQLELTFLPQEGEAMTLLDVGVQFGVTAEGYQGDACQFSYTTDENGTRLSGLLLRYAPDLYAVDLTFTHPLFRLNQTFEIPLHIPE